MVDDESVRVHSLSILQRIIDFLSFMDYPRTQCISNEDQLRHFDRQMERAFNVPTMQFNNWFDAFSTLAGLTTQGEYIILLDEISWMATHDKDLAGVLKVSGTHSIQKESSTFINFM